ncbi:Na-translocating system protein MpsC family protein [Paenibacillus sp. MMO-58]|uniref:Na-translocating system protein MpsC family protein n=1 Tax=Paenibacillus sp. MMO-58 TaxID=3081290 RepID=UPI0030163ACB
MNLSTFERVLSKQAAKFRRDFSNVGPEDTKVKVMDDFIVVKYIAHYTKPELFHHQVMRDHPEQAVYNTFLEQLASFIKADFSKEIPELLPGTGIEVEEVMTRYFSEDCSSQIILIRTNKNIELLFDNSN